MKGQVERRRVGLLEAALDIPADDGGEHLLHLFA
jgi:hypothetical protein